MTRPTFLLLAALAVAASILNPIPTSAAPGDPAVTGSFFVDFDRDGAFDDGESLADSDPLFPPNGISVVAYDVDGNTSTGLVTPGTPPTYSIDPSGLIGTNYRVEFSLDASDQTSGWSETFAGPHSPSSVQFVSAGDTAHFGVAPPSQCPTSGTGFDGNPNSPTGKIWTTCFVNGDRTSGGPQDVLVGLNTDFSEDVEHIGYKNGGTAADNTTSTDSDELGALWGMAYDEWTSTLYTSASLRRHSDLGHEGIDGLYWISYPSGQWQSTSLGAGFGTDPVRDLGAFDEESHDTEAFNRVGASGIGDIDLAPDGRTLGVMNLEAKQVEIYDVAGVPSGGVPQFVRSVPISNPCASVGTHPDDWQPYALQFVDNTSAFVGVTCTAESSQDPTHLAAHLLSLNLDGSGQTPLVGVPLDYTRSCSFASTTNPSCSDPSIADSGFSPWVSYDASAPGSRLVPDLTPDELAVTPTPLFSDIEVELDGSLIVAIMDRTAMQLAGENWGPDPADEATKYYSMSAGELLRVCNTSGDPLAPTYVVEEIGSGCEPNFVDATGGNPNNINSHFGPYSTAEFYGAEVFATGPAGHPETAAGGIYLNRFTHALSVSSIDPLTWNSGGLSLYDSVDGSVVSEIQLYVGSTDDGFTGKGMGVGDVEGCFIPLEVGDRVWLDLDNDGIQDPGELALAGVTVTVTGPGLPAGGLVTTTDANGLWKVNTGQGIAHNETYSVAIDVTTNTTPLPTGFTNADLSETIQNAGSNDGRDSNVSGGTMTVTTGDPGVNDHSFDAGYILPYDLALRKTLDSADLSLDTITFNIEVINQGAQVENFEVTDYVDTPSWGTVVDASGTTNDVDLDNDGSPDPGTGLAFTWSSGVASVVGVLPAGQSVTIPVTVLGSTPITDSVENWAEISNFDSDGDASNGDALSGAISDTDSTPDDTQSNDVQPTGAGEPGDDVVTGDGVGTDPVTDDEDDHDVAGFELYDLTLIKELATGQGSVIQVTDTTVEFTITVKNQGAVAASDIEVTDYAPTGTEIAGTATDAGLPTGITRSGAVFTIASIAPGASVSFDVTIQPVAPATDFVGLDSIINGAEISADDGDDVDSSPDGTDDDDYIEHDNIDYDPDNDGYVHETTPGDEDDHDREIVNLAFDLALTKTVDSVSAPLVPGGSVTFLLTVTNQGQAVERIELTDYITAADFAPITIDATTNAPGSAGGTSVNGFSYTWTGDGTLTPQVILTPDTAGDRLDYGETLTVPVTLSLSPTWDGSDLDNWAEISMFDDDSSSANGDSNAAGTGTQLFDWDSTPDTDRGNDNQPTSFGQPGDDVITGDGTGTDPVTDDEDDHDVAGVQVYDVALIKDLAASQGYVIDMSTTPPQVAFSITVKNQGNHPVTDVGIAEHVPTGSVLNGTATDAANSGVTGLTRSGSAFTLAGPLAPGATATFDVIIDITDLNATPFLNEAEISNIEDVDGNPVVDIDSTVDSVQGNDTVENVASPGDPVETNSHDDIDNDRTGTGAPISTPNDDDDHGQEQVVVGFDQALIKTIDRGQTSLSDGVQTGDKITFNLTVTNQGSPIQTIEITDYVQPGFTYVAADNAAGTVNDDGDGDGFSYSWNATSPVVTLVGDSFDAGESLTVPITLTVDGSWTGGSLENWAEISRFDNDTDAANGDSSAPGTGQQLTDIDSMPDATDGSQGGQGPGEDPDQNQVDDVIDGDSAAGGDEDDHDGAQVPVWDLSLIKTRAAGQGSFVDLTAVPPTISFDITVDNQGSEDVWDVGVVDYFPSATSYSSAVVPAGVTDNTDGTFVIDTIAAGDSVTLTITLALDVADLHDSYTNIAEITTFDDDDDNSNSVPSYVVDVDSTPDATQDEYDPNDPANDDTINHNDADYDPDTDGNLNETTAGDEDDHDIETVGLPFDLALRKTINTTPDVLIPGGVVTFDIEVFNQGRSVETIDVTDYADSSLWTLFEPALNDMTFVAVTDNGNAAAAFEYRWTGSGSAPIAELRPVTAGDQLAPGESLTISIALRVSTSWDGRSTLENFAEISNFDDDAAVAGDSSTGALTDVDSTPDSTNDEYDATDPGNDELVDDVIDNSNGDEDDHDVAGVDGYYDLALIKTLGSGETYVVDPASSPLLVQFDITVKNQGTRDAFAIGVTDHLAIGTAYSVANAASMPTVTSSLTPVVVTDNGDGTFVIDELAPGDSVVIPVVVEITDPTIDEFVNGAEITVFDDDDPATGTSADANGPRDIDSTPNGDATDDAIDQTSGIDPSNNDDRNSHNDIDNDRDGNGDAIATLSDEDDHDVEVVVMPYDLALRKVVDTTATTFPLSPGDDVTFTIEVINQGRTIESFDVVDYIDLTSWSAFSAASNPDGTTGGDHSWPYSWDTPTPAEPLVSVVGSLGYGETVTIPVVLTIPAGNATNDASLVNAAEIAAFDNDTDDSNEAPTDVDSTPDDDNTDPVTDDEINENVSTGDTSGDGVVDEDDHDIASVVLLDLALRKHLDPATVLPVQPGQTITFNLEIINQGNVDASSITVVDYVDTAMWNGFDPALNLAGTTTGDQALAYTWSASGTDGLLTLSGTVPVGATVFVPVSLTLAANADLTTLQNVAEISGLTATVDDDDDPLTPPVVVVNPDGSTVVDSDSTPDTDNTDPMVDDVIDNSNGDEDDHDVAVVPVSTWSLGNQVWFDVDNDGVLEAGEALLEGVAVTLYADVDGNGVIDLDGSGSPIVLGTDVTDADGAYLFDGLAPGGYIVGVDATNFEVGGPLENLTSSTPTEADPNTDVDDDDNGIISAGQVLSGTVTLGDGEPSETGFDNDPTTDDGNENLTVDFGFWLPAPDLALRKSLDPTTSLPVNEGAPVVFSIEIINQGNTDASDISIIDYVDPAMWVSFDPAANPDGVTGGDRSLGYTWAAVGDDGQVTLSGVLGQGETVTVPVTLRIASGADLDNLVNVAEITDMTPVIDDADPLTSPIVVVTPDGEVPTDVDSTPDSTDGDPLVDNVIDNSSGDEDDHDIALVEPPVYSLGNQVWADVDNDGVLDPDEEVFSGVVVELFTDNDGDGLPDDTNGDGRIDSADAIATQTTDEDGGYLFTGLASGDYIVGIAPENWDETGELYGWLSSDPTETDANTDVDNDDNGTPGVGGYVWSGPVTLSGVEPLDEPGLSNDAVTPDANSNLTVDFGFWQPVFDLALRKQFEDGTNVAVADIGSTLTYTIEVFNQGNVAAANINVIDYLPEGLTLNDADWQLSEDGSATGIIAGPIQPGESATIDITVNVTGAGAQHNQAEIVLATAVDQSGTPMLMPNGQRLPDVDSTPDDDNSDPLVDDVTDNTNGDEDDHDTAVLTVTERSTTLAFTGTESARLVGYAILLIAGGLGMVVLGRRRRGLAGTR